MRGRLAAVTALALVVCGEVGRIGDPNFGRVYAAGVPAVTFLLVEGNLHPPQIGTPEALIDLVWTFADRHPTSTWPDQSPTAGVADERVITSSATHRATPGG